MGPPVIRSFAVTYSNDSQRNLYSLNNFLEFLRSTNLAAARERNARVNVLIKQRSSIFTARGLNPRGACVIKTTICQLGVSTLKLSTSLHARRSCATSALANKQPLTENLLFEVTRNIVYGIRANGGIFMMFAGHSKLRNLLNGSIMEV